MGLAAPKRKTKISHDPNNTKWHGNQESIGRKLMAAQGWEPGQYLGAKNANHADHYTVANASHIRVTIKDDNLGLGAKIGSGVGHGECTGLDAFKDILGRLNGKDEDMIAKEQKSREDLKMAIYTERKWGSQRFVPGGFLVGDKIEHLIAGEAERLRKLTVDGYSSSSEDSAKEDEESPEPVEKFKKSKKRKSDIETEVEVVTKTKKSKKRKVDDEVDVEIASKKSKKVKNLDLEEELPVKVKKSKKRSKAEEAQEADVVTVENPEKEQRRQDKREKKARKEQEEAEQASTKESKKSKTDKRKGGENPDSTQDNTPSIPTAPSVTTSGVSTPIAQGLHAIRARNIAQKRLASVDVASLNQIFMIKAP